MPIYEYECPEHGRFEIIQTSYSPEEEVICTEKRCFERSPLQISLPTMRPDKYWSGAFTHSGDYVTSCKEFEAKNKHLVPADRNTREYAEKLVKIRKEERLSKNKKNLEKFLAKELAPVTID